MLLNNKHYYNLQPEERKNLWKHYKKVYPNMGYSEMVNHFNGEVENYQFGGETNNQIDGEKNNQVYTYQNNPEYFNNKAVIHENPQYNELIKKSVYAGTHGYNSSTGELIKLKNKIEVPEETKIMSTEKYGKSSQRERFANNPELRKQYIQKSTKKVYQNPLMTAPGMIGMAALPIGFASAYGLSSALGNLGQGNYKTAGLEAGLSMLPFAGPGINAVKPILAKSMESGLLSNTYKLNPWRFKPKTTSAYRMIGNEKGLTSALESGYLKPSTTGSDIGKIHSTSHYQIGAPSDTRKYFGRSWGRGYEGPYMAEVPNAVNDVRFSQGPGGKGIGADVWTYPENYIPTSEATLYKQNWLKGYKPIKTPSVGNVDFSKYLTQEEAVAARAERLLSQKHKKGWNEQLNSDIEENLQNAVKNHDPAGDYPGTSLGANLSGRTKTVVSKDANLQGVPLSEANKARIAAHETGHYYSNSLNEGESWKKYFDFTDVPYRTSKYLKGKSNYRNFGNELRERAAQLKDYIAQKNNIPLNKDFKITRSQLDDALENYIKDTQLDNTMTPFITGLKKKGNISGFLKEMNKRPLILTGLGLTGAGAATQQKNKNK
jgi:hypothetical protein